MTITGSPCARRREPSADDAHAVALSQVAAELQWLSPGRERPLLEALAGQPTEVVVCAARVLAGTTASPVLLGGVPAFLTVCQRLTSHRHDPVCDWAWDWYLDRLHLMPVELVCDALLAAAVD